MRHKINVLFLRVRVGKDEIYNRTLHDYYKIVFVGTSAEPFEFKDVDR